MTDVRPETPTVEVRVYREGALVLRELCDSEAEAAAVVSRWEELEGVRCEVDDLAPRSAPAEVDELEPAPDLDERAEEH